MIRQYLNASIAPFKLVKRGCHLFGQQKPNKEIIQSYWQVEQKAEQLAQMISIAKYPIFFTGAGISTSIGIPDYRSGQDTVIKTGPGLWNRTDIKTSQHRKPHQTPIDKLVDLAKPSLTHMFITTLLNKDKAKYLVSQNTDGLHLRSGVSMDCISELHGNRNLEHCVGCGRKYVRDYRTLRRDGKVYKPGEKRDHFTGRHCQNCRGELHDSIIYFGQKLPTQALMKAYFQAHEADLCICIGSSLTVKPSSLVPIQSLKKDPPGKLCIVNLQETPLDSYVSLKINYFCDDVFELVAKKMGLDIQPLVVRHYLEVRIEQGQNGRQMVLEGKDKEGNNLTFIRGVTVRKNDEVKGIDAVGHSCSFTLQDMNISLELIISHFGDKQPLSLILNPLQIAPSRLLTYSKISQNPWQVNHLN